MPADTYAVSELIKDAPGLLGVESFVAAGALYGQVAPLSIADAQTLVASWRVAVQSTGAEQQGNKDIANGYAGLDGNTKLKMSEMPNAVVTAGQLTWQANTFYKAGMLTVQAGVLYQANADFTSAATWGADASNWTALTAAGVELAYAQITADTNVTGAAYADVAGLSITPTVGARPIMVEFFGPACAVSAAGNAFWQIMEDGVAIGNAILTTPTSGGVLYQPMNLKIRRAPAAGAHTYKVQAKGSAAGISALMYAAAYAPVFIQATQL